VLANRPKTYGHTHLSGRQRELLGDQETAGWNRIAGNRLPNLNGNALGEK